MTSWRLAVLLAAASLATAAAAARTELGIHSTIDPTLTRIDEARHLGTRVPEVTLLTEEGPRPLIEPQTDEPVLLLLGYFGCRGVCPATLQLLARTIGGLRSPHRVVVLSFDTRDTLETLRAARAGVGAAARGWTFGLLPAQDAARLTEAIGYRYVFVERDRVFVHPNVLVFLSPDGRVVRYLGGAQFERGDVELALAEARAGTPRAGGLIEALKLACYAFDPSRSRYVLHPVILFGGAGLGMLAVAGLATAAFRPERRWTQP